MRLLPSLAASLLTLGLVSGCGSDGPDGDALASALSSGKLSSLSATAQKQYGGLTDGMGVRPSVSAGDADVDGQHAEVPLTWRWSLPGKTWTYETHADYTKRSGGWRLDWSPRIVNDDLRSSGDRLVAQRILAKRGEIRGAGGARLVRDRAVETYGIDKARVDSTAAAVRSARLVARAVDVDVDSFVKQVRAAGPKAFVAAITYRKGEAPPAAAKVENTLGGLVLPGTRALGPTKEFAAPILGSVGPVTAEIVKKNPGAYRPGDDAGLSGLESRYDDQLRGQNGVSVEIEHRGSRSATRLLRVPARAGKPLQTTLDQHLQSSAEHILSGVGPASALVALRPSDGAILAAASGPGAHGVNLATYGTAAPGSTFKTVDSLALLRKGLTPQSTVSCPSSLTVDGKKFSNDSWYPAGALGQVPLATAIAESCNTAMIGQHDRIDHQQLVDAAASLGFGIDHDLGFPAYFGKLSAPGSETGHAAEMIGQGTVLASPMVMATVMGSIQAGHTVVPHLLDGVDGLDTDVPKGVTPLTGKEAREMRTLFRAVVTRGTGAGLADVPGGPVIAKTGTAEFDRDGKRLTHTWMIAAQGDLAVAAYVDEGKNGSSTAGPLVEQLLRAAH